MKLKNEMKIYSFITLTLVILGSQAQDGGEREEAGYTITPAVNEPGLVFASMFHFKLVNDHWTLLTRIPVVNLRTQHNTVTALFTTYLNLARKEKDGEVLKIQLQNLGRDIAEVTRALGSLRTIFGSEEEEKEVERRRRRGIFNSLGSAIKLITGNLDHEDAEYYDAKLKQVEQGARDVYQLARAQASVIATVIHSINGTLSEWEGNRRNIELALNQIKLLNEELESKVKETRDELKLARLVTESHTVLIDFLNALKENIQLVMQAYDEARAGRLSPLIVSPDFLLTALHRIQLPAGLSFPVDLTDHKISAYYSLIEVSSFVSNASLNLVMGVPLVSAEQYTMYQVIPFPFAAHGSNDTLVIIKPEFDYVGVSNSDLHYLPYSELNLKSYKTVATRHKICPVKGIIKDLHAHADTCIMSCYKNKKEIASDCEVRVIIANRPIWAKTPRTNGWFYVIPETERGLVSCRTNGAKFAEPVKVTVSGRGMITLHPGCQYASDSALLVAPGEYGSNYNLSLFVPRYSVQLPARVEETVSRLNNERVNFTFHLKPMTNHLNELADAGYKISVFKNMLDAAETERIKNLGDVRHAVAYSSIVFALFGIMLYLERKPLGRIISECWRAQRERRRRAAQVVYTVAQTEDTREIESVRMGSGESASEAETSTMSDRVTRSRASTKNHHERVLC